MAPRLTLLEIRALFNAVQDTIGIPQVVAAVTPVLGQAVVAEILSSNIDRKMTEDETCNLIFALEPLIPAESEKEKLLWLMREARRVFPDQARYEEVRKYVFDELHQFRLEVENVIPQRSLRPIRQGDPQAFYGRVNWWAEDWNVLLQDLDVCQECNVGYHIEMAAWAGTGVWNDPAKLEGVISTYKRLVAECRKRGLWLFVSVVNDNMHLSKYGNVGVKLSSVRAQANQLVAAIKECGSENVIVQPVGETQTDDGRAFEIYCAAELAGFILVSNGEGGSPSKKATWASFRAYHPSSVSVTVASDAFAVSDHGTIIKQLNQGGGLNTPGNPSAIKAWFAKHAAAGCPAIVLYHFQQQGHDADAIRACALSASQAETSTGADQVDFSKLVWHGDFNGASAVLDVPRLSNLVFHGTKEVTFKWDVGMASWGFAHESADAIASIFFEHADGVWRGGRFEWISTSRTQRDLENLSDPKFKFDLSALPNPCRGAMVVHNGRAGTKRSNVVVAEWRR